MAALHYTHPPYERMAACQWSDTWTLPVTTDISKITCRACLKAIIPAKHRTLTLEELRERAIKYNS